MWNFSEKGSKFFSFSKNKNFQGSVLEDFLIICKASWGPPIVETITPNGALQVCKNKKVGQKSLKKWSQTREPPVGPASGLLGVAYKEIKKLEKIREAAQNLGKATCFVANISSGALDGRRPSG